MIPTLFFYERVLVALAWLFLMLWWLWPHAPPLVACPNPNRRHHASTPTIPPRLQG